MMYLTMFCFMISSKSVTHFMKSLVMLNAHFQAGFTDGIHWQEPEIVQLNETLKQLF